MTAPGANPRSARTLARRHREALQSRARRIRRAVAALTAMLFACAFLVVYVQLASGHDPALAAAERKRAQETQSTSAAREASSAKESRSEESSTSESSTSETSDGSGSQSGESSSSHESSESSVTTRQS
jgi:type IV secretory pathway TrbL component